MRLNQVDRIMFGDREVSRVYLGSNIVWEKAISPEAFSPASLFAQGEVGGWYDPSDLSTLFQDAAGTIPVTAVEQVVGLMLDKSKELVRGPEATTNGTFTTDDGWTKSSATAASWSDGQYTISDVGGIDGYISQQLTGVSAESTLEVVIVITASTTGYNGFRLRQGNKAGDSTYGQTYSPTGYVGELRFIIRAGQDNPWITLLASTTNTSATVDSISVREIYGNHAYQTAASRKPELSARVNLLTKTEQFDDVAWTKTQSVVVANQETAPDGTLTADKFIPNSGIGDAIAAQTVSVSFAGYTFQFRAKAAEQSVISLVSNLTGSVSANIFDLSAQTASAAAGWTASIAPDPAGGGWFICTCSASADTAASKSFQISNNSAGWTGDGTSGVYIWGASLVPGDLEHLPYQRVNTATDYDADPAKFPHYLYFGGTDHFVTNTITSGTDKVQVFAGVRKLNDTEYQPIAELSTDPDTTTQSFTFGASTPIGDPARRTWGFGSRGDASLAMAGGGVYTAEISSVLAGIGDISGDSAIIRVNGEQAASSTADQGSGNYGNYPLYIGRRGGSTLPLKGRLHCLIVRFGSNLPNATIEKVEEYINSKTRAY